MTDDEIDNLKLTAVDDGVIQLFVDGIAEQDPQSWRYVRQVRAAIEQGILLERKAVLYLLAAGVPPAEIAREVAAGHPRSNPLLLLAEVPDDAGERERLGAEGDRAAGEPGP